MHIQKTTTDLRNVLQEREDWVWSQCGKLLEEVHVAREEGEEEEQVRHRLVYFILNSKLSSCKPYMFEAGARNNKDCA